MWPPTQRPDGAYVPPRTPRNAPGVAPTAVLSADGGGTRHGRHRRAPEKQASYREVFAIREFRGLWVAQVMSYSGDQFAQVAIAILVTAGPARRC